MSEVGVTQADLAAAVAAGQISEAQAAGLAALAKARASKQAAQDPGDEPFELYRGLNDIFVTIGLIVLLLGLGRIVPGSGPSLAWSLFMSALLWGLAEYFTGYRRMVAPSIVLVLHFCYHIGAAGGLLVIGVSGMDGVAGIVAGFVAAAAAATVFYRRFGLPFALFPAGASLLAAALATAGHIDQAGLAAVETDGFRAVVDLGSGAVSPFVTLAFGLAAFALALRHDLQDPHRVTRHAACGFWLHLLAAPAIVNTAAFTLYSGGGWPATAGLACFLAALAMVALVIDRRSFLIAAVSYIAALLIAGLGESNIAAVLVLLGLLILGLGAGWAGLRAGLMRRLPAFPGKDRLPPWQEPAT